MSSTILEQKRANHEELERLQVAIINVLEQVGTIPSGRDNYKIDVVQSHAVNHYLERMQRIGGETLPMLYEDKDKLGQEELAAITGSGPQAYSAFYERLKEVRRYHTQYPSLIVQDPADAVEIEDMEKIVPQFSGEEGFGKNLDLHVFFDKFINFRTENRMEYARYVERFYKFAELKHPRSKEYKIYLQELLDYLTDFMRRTRPLSDLKSQLDEINERWKAVAAQNTTDPLFCKACGKSFTNQNVFNGHLAGKKHQKAAKKTSTANNNNAKNGPELSLHEEIQFLEFKISEICNNFLLEQILNTKSTIEMKFSRTITEIIKGLEHEEKESNLKTGIKGEESDEEDETEIKTTKDNYPVGWDGKPIPYWLYKLHGLGVEYKCEICGNHSYWGRKNFEAHFQEARHARGMKVLGIPNTKHFHNITIINDAVALWQKIQRDSYVRSFQPENEEEYEDSEGNVYKRKVFEDLKRQGLV